MAVGEVVETAKCSVLERAGSFQSAVSEATAWSRDFVVAVGKDVQKKGIRTWAHEAAAEAAALAGVAASAAGRRAAEATERAGTKAIELRSATGEFVARDDVKATAAGAAAGAVVVGTGGAATGTVAGGVLGTAVGFVAAPLTLGLSVPIGALLGGGAGLATGAAAGGATGLVGGGAAGYGIYQQRDGIRCLAQQGLERASASALALRGAAAAAGERVGRRARRSSSAAALDAEDPLFGRRDLHPLKQMAKSCIESEVVQRPSKQQLVHQN